MTVYLETVVTTVVSGRWELVKQARRIGDRNRRKYLDEFQRRSFTIRVVARDKNARNVGSTRAGKSKLPEQNLRSNIRLHGTLNFFARFSGPRTSLLCKPAELLLRT